MNLIFSADQNWGIGCENRLLYRIPTDMRFFRQMTTGKVIVMGRNTLESLPGGKPLRGRTNIVLTANPNYQRKDAVICHTLQELFAHLEQFADDDIFVIGGEQIIKLLMPYCRKAYVTRFSTSTSADTHAPNFDHAPGWILSEQSEQHYEGGIYFRFCIYLQQRPLEWAGEHPFP